MANLTLVASAVGSGAVLSRILVAWRLAEALGGLLRGLDRRSAPGICDKLSRTLGSAYPVRPSARRSLPPSESGLDGGGSRCGLRHDGQNHRNSQRLCYGEGEERCGEAQGRPWMDP